MMSKPVILITSGRHNQPVYKREVQAVLCGCNMHYVSAVLEAGGVPVLLPSIGDDSDVREALKRVDGVILSGGGDVCSLEYGEEPHPRSYYQDPDRDQVELSLVKSALELEKPILGICRGIQLLNVALGGTLVQDVPSQVSDAVKHYSDGINTVLLHNISIEPGSLLADVVHQGSMAVNSWHHQAVKELGAGLRVNARASDGVIEGVESSEGKPMLAVQYHPEECVGKYLGFQELFDWLVREASS